MNGSIIVREFCAYNNSNARTWNPLLQNAGWFFLWKVQKYMYILWQQQSLSSQPHSHSYWPSPVVFRVKFHSVVHNANTGFAIIGHNIIPFGTLASWLQIVGHVFPNIVIGNSELVHALLIDALIYSIHLWFAIIEYPFKSIHDLIEVVAMKTRLCVWNLAWGFRIQSMVDAVAFTLWKCILYLFMLLLQ